MESGSQHEPDRWIRRAAKALEAKDRPLFAPVDEELEIYRRHILRVQEDRPEGVKALILGMTPELADLALANECLVFRVDRNPKVIEAARGRQKVSDPPRDTVIEGDWLDMHMIQDGRMDLVLGDASLNNVPHVKLSELLDELLRVTHPGSLFLFKQHVIPNEPIREHEFDNVMASFRQGQLGVFDFFRIIHFYSFIADAYDPSTRELHAPRILDALEKKHDQGVITDEELKLLKSKMWNIVHTIYGRAEQEQILRRLGRCSVLIPNDRPMYRHIHMFAIARP